MKKTTKRLGPSNDNIPDDEIVLAKLIQTASAKGLHSHQHSYFKGANGTACFTVQDAERYGGLVACCAVGAAILDPEGLVVDWGPTGNDTNDGDLPSFGKDQADSDCPGFTVGAAFEQALRPD